MEGWRGIGVKSALCSFGDLDDPAVRLSYSRSGHYDLPELDGPGTKRGGTAEKVKTPHPVKTLIVFLLQAGPGRFEIGVPGHQGPVVVFTEIMPVLHH